MRHQTVLQLDPTPTNSRNSEGAFVTLKSGRVMFAYTKYKGDAEDDGHAIIASRFSDDGGATWSRQDEVVVQQEGSLNVMSVSLLRLQNGRIAMFNLRKDPGICMPYVRFSDDEFKTFTAPLPMIGVPGYYVVNNDRVVQLASGRLVAPVALHRMRGANKPGPDSAPAHHFDEAALVFFYMSDDGGEHWFESNHSLYKYSPLGFGLQEPGVMELLDGRLWAFCRTGQFGLNGARNRQQQTFSTDRGATWSPVEDSQFVSPCSPLSMKRVPRTGDLLAVWNDHSGRYGLPEPTKLSWGRTPLASAISSDDGKTWKHHRLVEDDPRGGYCYIAIHFVDDHVLLAYCAGGEETQMPLNRLRVKRIPLADVCG
jgi:sialidase-1